ncbi:MAG: hypothetical protein C0483_25225 [Pirellula sp.]|nr:hypothetical protein [Pirellula sp.]
MDGPPFGSSRLHFPGAASTSPPQRSVDEPSQHDARLTATTPAERACEGLRLLLQSQLYADDVGADGWEFALDLVELKTVGLTSSDLRWLVLKGYAQHARETTLPGDAQRSFRPSKSLTLSKRTCFVITDAGIEAARQWIAADEISRTQPTARLPAASPTPVVAPVPETPRSRMAPHWDSDLQELRVNGLIVKRFKVPAPNQEMILAAFEEEHWPARIDDPLPPHPDQDPKRRLHDTIVSLNRNHKSHMIRFMGDGSGQGVRWSVATDQDDGTS